MQSSVSDAIVRLAFSRPVEHSTCGDRMDSKDVNRAIRSRIRPLLKAAGFDRFTSRTAWRFCGPAIGVVNFQSFNSYIASGVGCTTFSFAINLGCHYTFLPEFGTSKLYDRNNRPQEYHCAFRRALRKSLAQPNFPRPDIWLVEADGSNLSACIEDAAGILEHDAKPWLDRLKDAREALRIAAADSEKFDSSGPTGTWGFGRKDSPMWQHVIQYLSAALNAANEGP